MPREPRQGSAVEHHILAHAHVGLEPLLARIETTAGLVGTLPDDQLVTTLTHLLDEFATTLPPHIAWEEAECYTESEKLADTAWATRCLRLQHAQLRRSLQALQDEAAVLRAGPPGRSLSRLRGHLYAFHALFASHLEQEEDMLVPLLDAVAT